MLKKFAALLLSLVICLSLVPSQAQAAGEQASDTPSIVTESLLTGAPNEFDSPEIPASPASAPDKEETGSLKD